MFRRSLLGALVLVSLLTGCRADAPSENAAEALTCLPDTLGPGDTLRVAQRSSFTDLSIADPRGTVYHAFTGGAAHPLLAPAPTTQTNDNGFGLAFPVDSLEMKPVAYDARPAIPVFRRTGTYRLYQLPAGAVTDTTTADCTIEYAGSGA